MGSVILPEDDEVSAVHVPFAPPKGMKAVISVYGNNKVTPLSKGNCRGDLNWEMENLVILRKIAGTKCNIQIHRKLSTFFVECLEEAIAAAPEYRVRMLGGYCARHQRHDPKLPLSIHSYGAAFDVNWDTNGMGKPGGKTPHDLPPEFVAVFKKYGWEWGGDWKSIKDYMHFQYALGV